LAIRWLSGLILKDWLLELEAQSQRREQYLKVYLIYGNGENNSPQIQKNILADICFIFVNGM